jgi:hypothetical protein
MTRNQWLLLFLWAAVNLTALWVGGTLYQMLVIVPLDTRRPDSILHWMYRVRGAVVGFSPART